MLIRSVTTLQSKTCTHSGVPGTRRHATMAVGTMARKSTGPNGLSASSLLINDLIVSPYGAVYHIIVILSSINLDSKN